MPSPHVVMSVDSADADKKLARLRLLPVTSLGRLKLAAEDLLQRMRKPGIKAPRHQTWDSNQQQIAWFASDGFTLPLDSRPKGYVNSHDVYQRSGVAYENGWVINNYGDFGYIVENPLRAAPYVGGDASGMVYQSNLHATRWRSFHSQIQIVIKYLPNVVSDAIRRFIDSDR